MRPEQRYQQLVAEHDSSFSTFIGFIHDIDIAHRKVLLKACRIQGPFSTTSRFYQRYKSLLEDEVYRPFDLGTGWVLDASISMNCWDLISTYSIYFSDPIACGYISMLLRYLSYRDETSAYQEIETSIQKELTASQGGGKKAPWLNHRSVFVPDRHHPYRDGFASDHRLGIKLRGGIHRLSKNLLVPRLGKKHIPLPDDYDSTYKPYELANHGKPIRTLADVERVYYKTGVELYGTTRMKSVWRGNDLKPRVYYSRGASLHRASTYIQQIFNAFVDALENTHRHTRHETHVLKPGADELLAIYDYSSFTSNLSEIVRFTGILADHFMETFVTVLDPHYGPTSVSLGVLLHEYNEACNRHPIFDASEIMQVEEFVLNHNAGMLGVPGNISSCTLLHGIHLALLVQSVWKNKVVGDDAIHLSPVDKYEAICEAIQDLGDVAMEKMESWEHDDEDDEIIDHRFDYKKRPLNRIGDIVFTGNLMDFPPLPLVGIYNRFHRHFDESTETKEEKAIRAFCRFFDNLARFPEKIKEPGRHIVFISSIAMYALLGWRHTGGHTKLRNCYPPLCDEGLRYSDWIMHFSSRLFMRLPVQYVNKKRVPDSFDCGQVFYQPATSLISYFVAIGCIQEITEYEYVCGKDLVDYFGNVSSRIFDSRPCRRYEIVDELPFWFPEYFVSLEKEDVE